MAASARCSGVVLGVLLLGCVIAALPLLGIPGTVQNAIYGAVIVVALLIDRSVRLARRRGALHGSEPGHDRPGLVRTRRLGARRRRRRARAGR